MVNVPLTESCRVLKPEGFSLLVGDVVFAVIMGKHSREENDIVYVPMRLEIEGKIALNKISFINLVPLLGSDSVKWIGAKCRLRVVESMKPLTKQFVLGWSIEALPVWKVTK